MCARDVLHLSVCESLWMGFYSSIALLWFLFPFFFGMCAHTLETEERREARSAAAPALQKGTGDGGVPFLLGSLLWVSPLQQGL